MWLFLWYAAGDFTCSAEADSTCAAGRDAGICIPYNIQIGKAFHIGAKPVPTFFFCPGRNRTPSAQAVSVCFVRLPARTRPWLENDCPLDDWTFNRSLQKIRESYRTDSADKAALRQLKRPAKRAAGNSGITK